MFFTVNMVIEIVEKMIYPGFDVVCVGVIRKLICQSF